MTLWQDTRLYQTISEYEASMGVLAYNTPLLLVHDTLSKLLQDLSSLLCHPNNPLDVLQSWCTINSPEHDTQ